MKLNASILGGAVLAVLGSPLVVRLAVASPRAGDIFAAVRGDDPHAVRRCLDQTPAAIAVRDANGLTPLHWAIAGDRPRAFDMLIAAGADVQAKTGPWLARVALRDGTRVLGAPVTGWMPLHIAALGDHVDMAEVLLERGADLNAVNGEGAAPLHIAASEGHGAMLRMLLVRGADAGVKGGAPPLTPLQRAAFAHGPESEAVELLLVNAAKPDLLTACALGRVRDVERLLVEQPRGGATPESIELAPIYWAARFGQSRTVKLLIEKGADPNARDHKGKSSLIFAAGRADYPAVACLVEHGAKIDAADPFGATALHEAARAGDMEMIRLLLKLGATGDLRDGRGRTAAACARESGHPETAAILLVSDRAADRPPAEAPQD